MRCDSVATAKGEVTSNGRRQKVPREGSAIRAVYDLFMANRGKPIKWKHPSGHNIIVSLTDYYGLDIRYLNKQREWVLVGEWFGRCYVDYIADAC